jgi:hypothetical protein
LTVINDSYKGKLCYSALMILEMINDSAQS